MELTLSKAIPSNRKKVSYASYASYTLAYEVEGLLVDPTGKTVQMAHGPEGDLLPANGAFGQWWEKVVTDAIGLAQPEWFYDQPELTTTLCKNGLDARNRTQILKEGVDAVTKQMGEIAFVGGGVHPFIDGSQVQVYRKPLYLRHLLLFGQQMLSLAYTNALHIHVSNNEWDAREKRRSAVNASRVFIPLLAALTENGPFCPGAEENGNRDERHRRCWSLAGPMSRVNEAMSRSQFDAFLAHLQYAELLDERRKLWCPVLEHPVYPTVEIRMMSTPSEWAGVIHFALLAAALVAKLESYYGTRCQKVRLPGQGTFNIAKAWDTEKAIPSWEIEVQLLQAGVEGLSAQLKRDYFTGEADICISDSIGVLLDWLEQDEELVEHFDLVPTLQFIREILKTGLTFAQRQINFVTRLGSDLSLQEKMRLLVTEHLVEAMKLPL